MSEEEIISLFSGVFGCSLIILFLVLAVMVWWKIFAKAGYGGAFGLLMLIPVVNLVMICILAFGKWPVLREVEELRRQVRSTPQSPQPQNV
jgi:hypothetical protein